MHCVSVGRHGLGGTFTLSMDEEKAKAVAVFFNGEAWKTGGGQWVVLLKRGDGKLVVMGDEAITEYEDFEAFDNGEPANEITLC